MRRILKKINPTAAWTTLRENPVIQKEMRSRMRGWRGAIGLTGFLLLVGSTVALIYFGFTQSGGGVPGVSIRKNIGQTIFYVIYMLQLFIVILTAPGLTAGAIASEREQQTYDLLRTTLLSARSLVTGKLVAAVSFVLLMFTASIPLQAIGFVFGGVSLGEILLGFVILVLTALNFGAVGIFFSSVTRRTRIATVLAEVTAVTFSVALPVIALFLTAVIGAMMSRATTNPPEWILVAGGWLITILSPLATAVLTEVILIEEQTYFLFQANFTSSQVWVPSPWIGFVIIYPLITAGLLALAINAVRQPERQ